MATSITHGLTTVTPELVLGYRSSRPLNNLTHTILGRDDPAVTFKAAGLRTGTLQILCATHEQALLVELLHSDIGFFNLIDDDLPGLNMRYVPVDSIDMELDDESRQFWLVSVGFQEVLNG